MFRILLVCFVLLAALAGPQLPPAPAATSHRLYFPLIDTSGRNRLTYLAADPAGAEQLNLADANGGRRRTLYTTAGTDPQLGLLLGQQQWSPDGRNVFFLIEQPIQRTIYTYLMDFDLRRSAAVTLTNSLQAGVGIMNLQTGYSLSPDGRWIVFRGAAGLYRPQNILYRVDAATGAYGPLLTVDTSDSTVSWRPSSSWVVFSSDAGRLLVDAETGATIRLSDHPGTVSWSPGGDRLALDEPDGLYLMIPERNSRTRITAFGSQPAWSPDGRQIAFVAPTAGEPQSTTLYTVDPVTHGVRQLTTGTISRSAPLRWSPDSRWLSFGFGPDAAVMLWDVVHNRAGPQLCQAGSPTYLSWAADSSRLAVVCSSSQSTITILRPSGELIASFPGSRPVWAPY